MARPAYSKSMHLSVERELAVILWCSILENRLTARCIIVVAHVASFHTWQLLYSPLNCFIVFCSVLHFRFSWVPSHVLQSQESLCGPLDFLLEYVYTVQEFCMCCMHFPVFYGSQLMQCVLNGHWIVMEDIDFAPPDVVSMYL